MYSKGYTVERIAYDLKVSQRMVYYYLRAWRRNQDYFIKIAKDARSLSIRDEAMLPTDQPGVYKFKPW
jgi:predicted transcriptional regulator